MKLIVDENLPPRLARWLVQRGHDAVHVSDVGLLGASDTEILAKARAESAGIVTRDSDFDRLVQVAATRVIRLAIGNASTPVLMAWIEVRWPVVEQRWLEASESVLVVS